MLFDDISFRDSTILEVKENTSTETFNFLLNFPIDLEKNLFEKKILNFSHVIFYLKKEVPFSGCPTILEINIRDAFKHTYFISLDAATTSKYKIEIITTVGMRMLEFSNVVLLNHPE